MHRSPCRRGSPWSRQTHSTPAPATAKRQEQNPNHENTNDTKAARKRQATFFFVLILRIFVFSWSGYGCSRRIPRVCFLKLFCDRASQGWRREDAGERAEA